jgi:diketogulonate reductase-like aldo/keto reductase
MMNSPMPSGNVMPGLELGTSESDPGVVGTAVRAAVERCKYKHINCAAIYGIKKEIRRVSLMMA